MASSFPFPPIYIAPIVLIKKRDNKETAAGSTTSTASKVQRSGNHASLTPYNTSDPAGTSGIATWESDTETLAPVKDERTQFRNKHGFRAQWKRLVKSETVTGFFARGEGVPEEP